MPVGYVGVFKNKYNKLKRIVYFHLSDIPKEFRDEWDNLWIQVRVDEYDGSPLT